MRKFGLALLALLLLSSLLSLAFSASSNIAFTHPNKVEKWLNDSNLYGAFVANAIDQAQKTAGADGSGGVSLSDAVVKQSAQAAFSSRALQKDVNTVVESNYAWLEGKTATPKFSVNLADAKQSFAERVGKYVQTYLAGLPSCTAAQTAAIDTSTADPLTLTCRPENIDPAIAGKQVTDQIANNGDFLSDPVVTANSINPNSTMETAPYYQKLSSLPQVYQFGTKIPWAAAAVALASAVSIFFLATRKRKGVKLIAIVMAIAGIVLVLTRFVSNQAFDKAEHHIFNESTVGQLQKALTVFFNHIEDQLTKVDMWFGVAYLALAIIMLIVLRATRQKGLRPIVANGVPPIPQGSPAPTQARPTKAPKPASGAPKLPTKKKPTSYPKRPRLIQYSVKWRRGWDSNPRYRVNGTPVFETGQFNHSCTSP
jgi:hypothetical protein